MIPYGYTIFGRDCIIRLRMRITDADRELLKASYPNLIITETRKGFTMIEGTLPCDQVPSFRDYTNIYMLNSKILQLEAKRALAIQQHIGAWPEDADML